MGILEGWRSRLSNANEALASARKSWRDEKLSEREQRTADRERALAEQQSRIGLQLAEMRAIESRRGWRKAGLVVTAALAALLGFFVGSVTAVAPEAPPSDPATAAPIIRAAPQLEPVAKLPASKDSVGSADRVAATSSRPHYPNPDEAAEKGLYGTGKNFNVGWYCLDKQDQGDVTFEQCLGAAAIALSSSR